LGEDLQQWRPQKHSQPRANGVGRIDRCRIGWKGELGSAGWRRRNELWARHLGNDLDSAIATLPDDRLAVVGFEDTGSAQAKDYQSHVTAWIIDGSGTTLAKTRIRDPINSNQFSKSGRVFVVTAPDALYVASSWEDLSTALPVEIAKLRLDGRLLWRAILPDTASAVRARQTCTPTVAVDGQGDSGTQEESYVPLPKCQAGHPAALFLAIRKDGTMILSSSGPAGNVGDNCTWIGRLTGIF
jgi:hypothetical protein